jgi:hypothetical protein
MARPAGERPSVSLTPRARMFAGWLVAVLIVVLVAFLVGRLGSGDAPGATSSAVPSGAAAAVGIAFGTALDPTTGEVAADARVDRFAPGDPFAWSTVPTVPLGDEAYVEVVRIGGGPSETVQEPALHRLGPDARLIAFEVPADALFDAFGPGEYVMRVYDLPGGVLLAEGRFTLVDTGATPPPT